MTLTIGKTYPGKKTFRLPPELATETCAILGRRGSGKTHTAVIFAEEMLKAGQPIVILDPLGVWWGLRSSKDGKSAGFPIALAGGRRGDVPLGPSDGAALAEFIVRETAPIILDLSHVSGTAIKKSSKQAQRKFVADFLTRLFELKGDEENRTALHVFIDEADEFVPQRLSGEAARCFGAVDDIVRRGRVFGLGVTLISQRAAVVNKDVLTQTELLVAHQTGGVQDRKALHEWVRAHDEDENEAVMGKSITSLPTGRGWFWSPSWLKCLQLVDVRDRTTFDSSATPKAGQVRTEPRKLAQVDIEGLKAKLSKTVEEAKANDPKELRREIARLKAELAKGGSGEITREEFDRAMEKASDRYGELHRRAETYCRDLEKRILVIQEQVAGVKHFEFGSPASITSGTGITKGMAPRRPCSGAATSSDPQPKMASRPAPAASNNVPLGAGARKVLSVLIQFPDGCPKGRAATIAGYTQKKSTIRNILSDLRGKGLLVENGDLLQAKQPEASELLPDVEPLPTGEELVAYWREKIGGEGSAPVVIFDILHRGGGHAFDRGEISTMADVRGSTFRNAVSKLKGLGLIETEGKGGPVKISEHLIQ